MKSRRGPERAPIGAVLVDCGGDLASAHSLLRRDDAYTLFGACKADELNCAALDPQVETLVLSAPMQDRAAARALLAEAAEVGLSIMVAGAASLRPLRLEDLVGRNPEEFDAGLVARLIQGKRVLITGGGGSIGGELARNIAAFAPETLTLLDSSEANLYAIHRDVPRACVGIVDIRDGAALTRWFERARPDLVFHAAALKQVPLVQANPCEGVLTNVLGAANAADAAGRLGADFVFISTDKAVNPSGVMGAAKRLGEMLAQALDCESGAEGARYMSVRLGNVLGSTGSVAPMFEAQLNAGGPLNVTDPEVARYFLSIPQAGAFILQAAALRMIKDRGAGAAFVPDMGEPTKIVDLARDMIRLRGLRPGVDVNIAFIGLRPGEKLNEDLIAADETRLPDPAPGMMAAAAPARSLLSLGDGFELLTRLARAGSEQELVRMLHLLAAPQAGGARASA